MWSIFLQKGVNAYWRRDEFGNLFVENHISLAGISVLGYQELKKSVRAVAKRLLNKGFTADSMLIIRETLDTQ